MNLPPKIYVAGHRGMVGSAIVRRLLESGHPEERLLTRTHGALDLTNQKAVYDFFCEERPDLVYLAAAKVGGIHANMVYPADFIYQNLAIQINVIESAFRSGVKKLLFLGSSCIYPAEAAQPIPEDALLTGTLEPTNEPYAVAKIAGIKLCESYNRQYGVDYRSAMPTNLYGPGDNYHPENSHVVPALIRRFHEAKRAELPEVVVWGTGKPRREFLYIDDMASACVHLMSLDKPVLDQAIRPMLSHINVGYGKDISIAELACLIQETVGYRGKLRFDASRPDGMPRKLMNNARLDTLGWRPGIGLRQGLKWAYEDFIQRHDFLV